MIIDLFQTDISNEFGWGLDDKLNKIMNTNYLLFPVLSVVCFWTIISDAYLPVNLIFKSVSSYF